MTRPVPAWQLAEGDVLPGGARVLSIQRDPVRGQVRYATDDGIRILTGREVRVDIARRARSAR